MNKKTFSYSSGVHTFPLSPKSGNFGHGSITYVPGVFSGNVSKEVLRLIEADEKRFLLSVEEGQIGTWDWDLQNDTIRGDKSVFNIYGANNKKVFLDEHMKHGEV